MRKTKKTQLVVLAATILVATLSSILRAEDSANGGEPSTTPLPPEKAWFEEARFGLFIHWGIYSVPAGEYQGGEIPGIGEHIMRLGKIPIAEYREFAKGFTADKYDPESWADLAKEAGMRYVVITAKHHDGFALYDSKVTRWDAVDSSPAGRDLIEPLAKAVRDRGLKFGLYYSQAQDWVHPGGAMREPWDPSHGGDMDAYIQNIALPQTREILELYRPDILWWDTPRNMTPERAKPFHDIVASVPGMITNDRLGGGYKGDTRTPEQHIPPRGYPGERFEVCMTMNRTWGFKKNDHEWKSVETLLRNLSDITSKGGNFLLNIGPKPDGTIPQESIDRLKAIGEWMKTNGEAIYGSQAGPFPRRLPWGRVTQKSDGSKTTLYLHVWNRPGDGRILLPTLKGTPVATRILGTEQTVETRPSPEGLEVLLPGPASDALIPVVALEFATAPTVSQEAFVSPSPDGSILCTALDADPHGNLGGSPELIGNGPGAYIGKWHAPDWSVEYLVRTPSAGKWRVSAKVSTNRPSKVLLRTGKQKVEAVIPATGGFESWQTLDLGTLTLPEGVSSITLDGVREGWSPIQIQSLRLDPL